MIHQRLNWHPWAANPLDYVDKPGLSTPEGQSVVIKRPVLNFEIWRDGELLDSTDSNAMAAGWLSVLEAGILPASQPLFSPSDFVRIVAPGEPVRNATIVGISPSTLKRRKGGQWRYIVLTPDGEFAAYAENQLERP